MYLCDAYESYTFRLYGENLVFIYRFLQLSANLRWIIYGLCDFLIISLDSLIVLYSQRWLFDLHLFVVLWFFYDKQDNVF